MGVAGVDGCRGGWVVVWEQGRVEVVPRFAEIVEQKPELVVVDIPIGLPESGPRLADVLARAFLKGRGCCVFPAPLRGMLGCGSFESACAYGQRIHGRGISQQCWHIVPKIKDVDAVVTPQRQKVIREGHPEVSFAVMNGGEALKLPKSRRAGRDLRLELLERHFPGAGEKIGKHRGIQGDVIDAYAMLWTARRIANGTARALGESLVRDSRGLLMQISA